MTDGALFSTVLLGSIFRDAFFMIALTQSNFSVEKEHHISSVVRITQQKNIGDMTWTQSTCKQWALPFCGRIV